jgi:LacI family transcriptional regulator, repressor for deo operon, udp, cdd, tsx, nupC, and nupG
MRLPRIACCLEVKHPPRSRFFLRRPTIKDVARAAGVTYPTVSRVLSGKPYVALNTRARVMQAIQDLGYKPSAAARSMVTQRTHTIAMLVPHLADANFGVLFAGAEREARAHGYSVLVTDYDAALEEHGLLSEHRVDGALLVEPEHARGLRSEALDLPCVILDDVPVDNFGGARAIASHLKGLGHARVAFVGGPSDDLHAQQRIEGVRSVYPEANWFPGDWSASSGYKHTPRALGSGVTAILAANDFNALGAARALQEHGLSIPSDISLTGFDDIAIAQYFSPPLTTVRQPIEAQGARAAGLLLAKLQAHVLPSLEAERLEVVQRDSTGPPSQLHT